MAQVIDPAHLELILKSMGIENVKEVTEAFEDLAKTAKSTVQPLDEAKAALAELETVAEPVKEKVEEAAGKGDGEQGEGGFAGLTASILKLERAGLHLATGRGLERTGTLLEDLTKSIGGPAGLGFAISGIALAIDVVIPKLVDFVTHLDGAADAAARMQGKIKAAQDQMARLIEQPTEEEEAGVKAVKPLLAGRRGVLIAQGIEQALLAEMPEEARKFLLRAETARAAGGPETWETAARREALRGELEARRGAIYAELEAGRATAISQVSAMAGKFPGLFPFGVEQRFRQALPENIEAARRQAQQAEEVSRWAEDEYAKREAAQKEGLDIQQQMSRAYQEVRKDRADKAERARKEVAREDQHRALERARELKRESTPEAQMTRAVRELAPGLEQEGFDVQAVAREALRQLPVTGNNAVLAIQQAILAAYQRGLRIQQEDMARMQMFTEIMQGSR
jgi:hypothetical protein